MHLRNCVFYANTNATGDSPQQMKNQFDNVMWYCCVFARRNQYVLHLNDRSASELFTSDYSNTPSTDGIL